MKRSTVRSERRAQRAAQKAAGMKRPGGASRYARKVEWLRSATRRDENLGRQLAKEGCYAYEAERKLFGFDVADSPKPWVAS